MTELGRIHSALMNADISHSAFRLHVALVAALDGTCRPYFSPVSIPGLMAAVPGVCGRSLTVSTFRANLKELETSGLIAVVPSNRRKSLMFVRLLDQERGADGKLKRLVHHDLLDGESPWVNVEYRHTPKPGAVD